MDVILLVTKPLTLINIVISSAVSTLCIATSAWLNVVKSIIDFNVGILWKIVVLLVAFVSLPVRVFTALQRERALEMNVRELRTRLENMIWENKELEERLHRAVKERKITETVLEEIDDEHEKVLSRIDQLENELQDLREENQRLQEMHGKVQHDYKASVEKIGYNKHEDASPAKSWSTSYKSSCVPVQDMILHENPWTDYMQKTKHQDHLLPKASIDYYPRDEITEDDILERRRVTALSRSLFSSIMSLIVGIIIYEAENPCMPLVAALFFVVGMSLNSVLQFFTTIKNKPAFDAVTLLSINWFVLGTLTYPLLPGITRMLGPWFFRIADGLVT